MEAPDDAACQASGAAFGLLRWAVASSQLAQKLGRLGFEPCPVARKLSGARRLTTPKGCISGFRLIEAVNHRCAGAGHPGSGLADGTFYRLSAGDNLQAIPHHVSTGFPTSVVVRNRTS